MHVDEIEKLADRLYSAASLETLAREICRSRNCNPDEIVLLYPPAQNTAGRHILNSAPVRPAWCDFYIDAKIAVSYFIRILEGANV